MRLWSLSPQYLDRQGLLAVWREALLAKKVLEGNTNGYKNHSQLIRFKEQKEPLEYINFYLFGLYQESLTRGYRFDKNKIGLLKKNLKKIKVSAGQIKYEFEHLLKKLAVRDKVRFEEFKDLVRLETHNLFAVVSGEVELWERVAKE